MSDALLVILIAMIGFLAVILSLAVSKSANNKIMGVCGCTAIVVGIISYGYGYSYQSGFSLTVVIKTLLMVCRMFTGGIDIDSVSRTPLFANEAVVTLFWVGHFMAFYMTASTAVKVLGRRVLKTLRTRMLRKGEVCLIYDATPDSIRLAGERKKNRPMVLVQENDSEAGNALADSLGGVAFAGGRALCADKKFLKTIGMKGSRRQMDVYCIGSDPSRNLRYAEALLPALQEKKVDPDKLSLFLLGVPEERASRLLALDGRYGYGEVFSCSQYELIARLIVEKRPPWSFIRCDADGRAGNDFRVFVIGFGQMGQAVLRQLVINGQMEGSVFHAEVFDRLMEEERGFFDACCPAVLKSYDIVLHAVSARSDLFYDRMVRNMPNMIVLCSGDHKRDMELGQALYRRYGARPDRPCIVQCTPDSILIDESEFHLEQVNVRGMDRAAMALNHVFHGGSSPEDDWKACNPFSRASCRASVDFFPAHLHAAGVSREEALAGKWPPSPEVLENLSRTEHLRWCAFELSMGYTPMNEAELLQRCEQYRRGEIENIVYNVVGATHARLVPWEKLDALSLLIGDATGESVDYKAIDRNNVLAIPEILRQTEAGQ